MQDRPTLTAAFLKAHNVNFRPATVAEAEYIQRRLLAMGMSWKNGETTVKNTADIVTKGMNTEKGIIYNGVDTNKPAVLARVGDFPDFDEVDLLSPMEREVALLRREVVALGAKLDRVLAAVEPQTDKTVLRGKGHTR